MSTMDIGTVVKALRNGGRARRPGWSPNEFLELQRLLGTEYIFFMPGRYVWRPELADVLASDWEYTL